MNAENKEVLKCNHSNSYLPAEEVRNNNAKFSREYKKFMMGDLYYTNGTHKEPVSVEEEYNSEDISKWKELALDYISLKTTLKESIVNNYIPNKEGISFHDAIALSIGNIAEKLEQDGLLISELLEALKSENWDEKTKSAITKAETYLQTKN